MHIQERCPSCHHFPSEGRDPLLVGSICYCSCHTHVDALVPAVRNYIDAVTAWNIAAELHRADPKNNPAPGEHPHRTKLWQDLITHAFPKDL